MEILGFTALAVQLVQSPAAAPAMSDADTTPKSTPPAYVQRGDAVEARRQIYKERLQQVYAALQTRVRADAPDLLPGLQAAPPRPVAHGYQILPKLVPDLPATSAAPRARSAHYSWPWTEQMIERELKKIDALRHNLHDVGRPQHATLECRGSQVGGEGIDLLRDECGRECLPGNHAERVLRRYGSNGGRAEHAELMKRLEIGLNSCCSA